MIAGERKCSCEAVRLSGAEEGGTRSAIYRRDEALERLKEVVKGTGLTARASLVFFSKVFVPHLISLRK